jgi:hypothetical protein
MTNKPSPAAILLIKAVQSVLPETNVSFQQTDGATVILWAEYKSNPTMAEVKQFINRLRADMGKLFLQAVPTEKQGKQGLEVFTTTLRVTRARLTATSKAPAKQFNVGDIVIYPKDFNAVVGEVHSIDDKGDYILTDVFDLFGAIPGYVKAQAWNCYPFKGKPRMLELKDLKKSSLLGKKT